MNLRLAVFRCMLITLGVGVYAHYIRPTDTPMYRYEQIALWRMDLMAIGVIVVLVMSLTIALRGICTWWYTRP